MKIFVRYWLFLCILFITQPGYTQFSDPGNLVIVGGGLEYNNAPVFNEFIQLAGGTDKAQVAVIPTASGVPVQSFEYFKNELLSYGLKPGQVTLIPVSLVDDDSTLTMDESSWKNNGNEPGLAEIVKKSTAIWFTGGDQLRTLKALVNPDGTQSLVLQAVWQVYRNGGVIGGTSAGAAIMSDPMIGGGTSLAALRNGVTEIYEGDDFPEDLGVLISRGLGFFPHGMVDQHFTQRSRIGRLITVLMDQKEKFHLGFGIDENTALVYYGKQHICKVLGQNSVVVIKTGTAKMSGTKNAINVSDLLISYLDHGDSYDLSTGTVITDPSRILISGKESYKRPANGQGGILSPSPAGFRDLLTRHLMDNSASAKVSNLTFFSENDAFEVTFSKTPASQAFYSSKPDGPGNYTLTGIRMDIRQVKVSLTGYE